jgi:mannose-6-phosphate isomerase-like protein (cupin superfamily)
MRNTLLTYTAPGAGHHVVIGSFGTTYKVLSEASRGAVAVVEHTLGPGRLGSPLHRHSKEDEVSYVLEGTLTVQQGSRIERGGPGTCIHKPRGVYHAFWNSGPEEVRFLEVIAPGGFEHYFEELELLATGPEAPDIARLAALGTKFGVEFDFASLPDLLRRHRLTLG